MGLIKFLAKFIGTLILGLIYSQLIGLALGLVAGLLGFYDYLKTILLRTRVEEDFQGNFTVITNEWAWIPQLVILMLGMWLAFKTTKVISLK